MYGLFDAFWRAAVYCLRPTVILLSLLPLALVAVATLVLGYWYWEATVESVRAWLESSPVVNTAWDWLGTVGFGRVTALLAPLLVMLVVTPLLVIVSLLVVALLAAPYLVRLVAERRFPDLQARGHGALWHSLWWSLGSVLMALLVLVLTMPLWFIPPLVLILPPLIWGWLTYRVLAFDALALHADAQERRSLLQQHRPQLLSMGVITGLLGAAPSLVWASGVVFALGFVVLVPVAVWIYTLVFIFSSLWFAHYALAALQALRQQSGQTFGAPAPAAPAAPALPATTVPQAPVAPTPGPPWP